ncbi:MAG: type II secretion system protein [Sedimentisphaerales bacterium]|nr:type II secretion system protein [Sedimentisphaerales bacterium]
MQNRKSNIRVEVRALPRAGEGFSLIELLVVIAIIAVVGGAGIGLYAGTSGRLQVDKAARDFLLTAKYARIMAIEKQREYRIQLDSANNGFSLVTSEWNEYSEQTEETVVRDYFCKPVEFDEGIIFEDIKVVPTGGEEDDEEEEQIIRFSPDGSAEAVVVQIGDGRTHYTVSISASTGKAKIVFGAVENTEIGTIDLDTQ